MKNMQYNTTSVAGKGFGMVFLTTITLILSFSFTTYFVQAQGAGVTNRVTNFKSDAVTDTSVALSWDVEESGSFSFAEQVNRSIPDNTGQSAASTITVADAVAVGDSISASVTITHPFIGDLRVTLTAPNGTVVTLHDQTGGDQDNLSRTYTSELATLVGSSARGDWVLRVTDHESKDTGTLVSWTLSFESQSTIAGHAIERFTSHADCTRGTQPFTYTLYDSSKRSFVVPNLASATTYHFRIRALFTANDGTISTQEAPYTACVSATTSGVAPVTDKTVVSQAPMDLRSTAVTDTSISLAWDAVEHIEGGPFTAQANIPIPDNTGRTAVSTITVANALVVDKSTSAAVTITHPFIGDLRITLAAPNGTVVTLHDQTGGDQDNLTKTYTNELATLAGSSARGDWVLRVTDHEDKDTGTLVSWELSFASQSPITGYTIEYFTSQAHCITGTKPSATTISDASRKSLTVPDLASATTYYFRAKSLLAGDGASVGTRETPYTACISATTGGVPPVTDTGAVSQSLTGFRSTAVTDNSVALAWNTVERRSSGPFTTQVNRPIPDNTGQSVVSTSTVTDAVVVNKGTSVAVTITHSFIGDLRVTLTAPNGTVVTLHDRTGGNQDDLIKTYTNELTDLVGSSARGDWVLRVTDHENTDAGTLVSWTLSFGNQSIVAGYTIEYFTSQEHCSNGTKPSAITVSDVSRGSAIISDLASATTYYFRAKTLLTGGETAGAQKPPYTACIAATTSGRSVVVPAEGAITYLRTTHVTDTDTSVTLAWDFTGDASSVLAYDAELFQDKDLCSTASDATQDGLVDLWGEDLKGTVTIPDLLPNTAYYVRVRAYLGRDQGWTAYSDCSRVTAARVTNLRSTAATDTTATVTWDFTGDTSSITGYIVGLYQEGDHCITASALPLRSVYVEQQRGASTSSRVVVADLSPDTTYHFRVRAHFGEGQGLTAYSCIAVTTTGGENDDSSDVVHESDDDQVTNLQVIAVTDDSVSLTWDKGEGATSLVFTYDGGECTNFSEVHQPQGTIYTVTNLASEVRYSFNVLVSGAFSNCATVITTGEGGDEGTAVPEDSRVSNLRTTAVTGDSISIAWDFVGDVAAVRTYDAERFEDGDLCATASGSIQEGLVDISNEDVAQRTATVTGLSPNTTYYFRVRAYENGSWGAYSDCLRAVTEAKPLRFDFDLDDLFLNFFQGEGPVVSSLRRTAATDTSITLAWDLIGDESSVRAYDAEQFEDGDLCATASDAVQNGLIDISDEDVARRTVTVTNLSPNTAYHFRVRAYGDDDGWGAYSTCLRAVTQGL